MPERIIRTVDGFHGGVLVITGLWYSALGFTWLALPLETRQEGLSWIPIGWMNTASLGVAWVLVGVLAFIVGLVSRSHRKWEYTAYWAVIALPLVTSTWFAIAQFVGAAPRGLVTSVVYLGVAALLAKVAVDGKSAKVTVMEEL